MILPITLKINVNFLVSSNEQYQARDMFVTVADERVGQVVMPGIVPKLSGTPGKVEWAGPARGSHTETVLSQLGYSQDEIAVLAAKGVIYCAVSNECPAS